jgi:hypothetical protein
VRRGASFHPNKARRQRREKLHHLTAAKLLPDDDLLGRITGLCDSRENLFDPAERTEQEIDREYISSASSFR